MENPLNKKTHTEPRGGWTKDDRTMRCITTNCGHGRDESGDWIGTPLSAVTIDSSCLPVARATICRYCNRIYNVVVLRDAADMGISRDGIEACLRASRNGDAFTIEELKNGKLAEPIFSDHLLAIMAKTPARLAGSYNMRAGEYNPDEQIEPRLEQVGLPL